jgi:hypothetical protein
MHIGEDKAAGLCVAQVLLIDRVSDVHRWLLGYF